MSFNLILSLYVAEYIMCYMTFMVIDTASLEVYVLSVGDCILSGMGSLRTVLDIEDSSKTKNCCLGLVLDTKVSVFCH